MKKYLLFVCAACLLAACEKPYIVDVGDDDQVVVLMASGKIFKTLIVNVLRMVFGMLHLLVNLHVLVVLVVLFIVFVVRMVNGLKHMIVLLVIVLLNLVGNLL